VQPKILIVGVDRQIQDTLTEALSFYRFQVLSASDGTEALFQFGTADPDLVILDIPQPGVDRWETLERIRGLSNGVPIIALGTPHDPRTEVESLNHGADHFVVKPFGIRELCARVRALLRRNQRQPSYPCNKNLPAF
jgi:DNA-binding response OmpR family regulator